MLAEGDEVGCVHGRAEEEQMVSPGAVGQAEAVDAGLRLLAGPGSPGALQPLRIFSDQRAQQVRMGQQVVDVPVLAAGAGCVASQPRGPSALPA